MQRRGVRWKDTYATGVLCTATAVVTGGDMGAGSVLCIVQTRYPRRVRALAVLGTAQGEWRWCLGKRARTPSTLPG